MEIIDKIKSHQIDVDISYDDDTFTKVWEFNLACYNTAKELGLRLWFQRPVLGGYGQIAFCTDDDILLAIEYDDRPLDLMSKIRSMRMKVFELIHGIHCTKGVMMMKVNKQLMKDFRGFVKHHGEDTYRIQLIDV